MPPDNDKAWRILSCGQALDVNENPSNKTRCLWLEIFPHMIRTDNEEAVRVVKRGDRRSFCLHLTRTRQLLSLPALVVASLLLTGCAGDIRELGREPAMSDLGTGLAARVQPSATAVFQNASMTRPQSIWNGSRSDIFSDPRANRIGDVVTVTIFINDRATFGNNTDRSLEAKIDTGFNYKLGLSNKTVQFKPTITADILSSTQGQGAIDRSEKVRLSVAAVVTDVMPNGNLIISGSQEVRVNFEMRLLNVAGIVRPQDIAKDNTVSYDKIAEARISYGGRGRIMEVQQPAIGQQIYDRFKPI